MSNPNRLASALMLLLTRVLVAGCGEAEVSKADVEQRIAQPKRLAVGAAFGGSVDGIFPMGNPL